MYPNPMRPDTRSPAERKLYAAFQLWRFGIVGNFRLTDQWPAGSGEIFCTTVHAFKGLESPVVILAEVEPYGAQDLEPILYVGCSRACNHLIVLASERLSEDVRQRLRPAIR